MSQPKRGEVVLFKKNPNEEHIIYIKRLIGLPDDTIQIKDGVLYINEKKANRVKTNIGIMKNIFVTILMVIT